MIFSLKNCIRFVRPDNGLAHFKPAEKSLAARESGRFFKEAHNIRRMANCLVFRDFETAENRQAGIAARIVTAAGPLVEILSAVRAESLAVRAAERRGRQGQGELFPGYGREVKKEGAVLEDEMIIALFEGSFRDFLPFIGHLHVVIEVLAD